MSLRVRLGERVRAYRILKLVARDLDAFEAEEHALLQACEDAERDLELAREAEDVSARRASYFELVELGREHLERLRSERSAELGADGELYRREFGRAVLRRLSRFAPEIDPPV